MSSLRRSVQRFVFLAATMAFGSVATAGEVIWTNIMVDDEKVGGITTKRGPKDGFKQLARKFLTHKINLDEGLKQFRVGEENPDRAKVLGTIKVYSEIRGKQQVHHRLEELHFVKLKGSWYVDVERLLGEEKAAQFAPDRLKNSLLDQRSRTFFDAESAQRKACEAYVQAGEASEQVWAAQEKAFEAHVQAGEAQAELQALLKLEKSPKPPKTSQQQANEEYFKAKKADQAAEKGGGPELQLAAKKAREQMRAAQVKVFAEYKALKMAKDALWEKQKEERKRVPPPGSLPLRGRAG